MSVESYANPCSLPDPYPNYSGADCGTDCDANRNPSAHFHTHAQPNGNAGKFPGLHCRH
ncbi:MAG: hypothetical protein OXE02_08885 [Chloroflexi bacterium]|nr:hypothetical protein [Chloroflexota bacterium]